MKAVVWHGREDVRVDEVDDPRIEAPTDAIVRITSTGICGSDLHLYSVLGMFMDEGDIIGHEPMGIVEEIGPAVDGISPGDRVVVPFNISCGHCVMCHDQLYAQCETTQVRSQGKGAALFGYTRLYGSVPGAQAEFLRVPHADFGPIPVPAGPQDDRFVLLSDVLPTAWQAVRYADVPAGGTLAVFGLGPIGQMCVRVARLLGVEKVLGVDLEPPRLTLAARYGATVIDGAGDDAVKAIVDATDGRGAHSVIDAVGMEAHGSPVASLAQKAVGVLPKRIAAPLAEQAGVDRLVALRQAIDAVRRGGTVSIIGVYGGAKDPMSMLDLFDKGVQLRMGQAHVKRWVPEILPHLTDEDPLGTQDFVTHHMSLDEAPKAYEIFQKKHDGCVKVMLNP
jgi:threonine dehydrogenase-like Zn-dependent dehydrogenase